MEDLYTHTTFDTSRVVTRNYSTSFFSAVSLLDVRIRRAVFGIYGFVRLADEIVDTFQSQDQALLLDRLESEYEQAKKTGFSLNPIVHAFRQVVESYGIDESLIEAFLKSMRTDLTKKEYVNEREEAEYIYGSAEVVGLMCLKIFTGEKPELYEQLREPAMKLGSAFQKVNFLRDLRYDRTELGRNYFPEIGTRTFDEEIKLHIIEDIEAEFAAAYSGLRRLPAGSRYGVYLAYVYYSALLKKIKRTPALQLLERRVRVSDMDKMFLLVRSFFYNKMNWI